MLSLAKVIIISETANTWGEFFYFTRHFAHFAGAPSPLATQFYLLRQ
jgi:hypothetical protein